MKRSIGLLGLAALPILGLAPSAEATGAAACTITGTISFSPASVAATEGRWHIEPAVIDCRGLFRGWERILGPGTFTGSGSYRGLPTNNGTGVHHTGSGTVDYRIPTTETDVHLIEPQSFVLAGGGSFSTPTLRGTFQITPSYDGYSASKPLTQFLFAAEVSMVRSQTLATDKRPKSWDSEISRRGSGRA